MADSKDSRTHPFAAKEFWEYHFGKNNEKVDPTKPCWIGDLQGTGLMSVSGIRAGRCNRITKRWEGRDKGDSL